ncbi:general stress protein [Bacillus aquiflavi]|uniref:general stress protein n=1 Tax=Bacillus aquiflavi TaxID=2672567 RepID=UPI0013D0CB03|nr:general stress protein [Bacillus aquiflavi]
MKEMLEKRLLYLYSGELSSIIVFVFVSYLFNYAYPNLQLYSLYSFWLSFILLEWLLLQGTIYWYVKLKRLRNENTSITPIKIVRQLHCLKTLNIVMMITTIIAFIFDFIKWYPSLPLGGLSIALFIYIFAILEFINYFYIQLSYDNISDIKYLLKSKKLKKSCMNKDFKRIL